MGIFKNHDVNKPQNSGGAVYIEEGLHKLQITAWKSMVTRKKETALIVDFKVLESNNPAAAVGSARNYFIGENDNFFVAKARNLMIAACGLSEGLDSEKIESEDWNKMLEASVKSPIFVNKIVLCEGVRSLRKDPKAAAKADPTLLENKDWVIKNSYLRYTFSAVAK